MPASKHSLSAEHKARALLRALFVLSFGWLLLAALPVAHTVAQADARAELRAAEQAPAPIADVAAAQASMRALSARIRSGASQLLATPQWLAALMLSPRPSARSEHAASDPTHAATRRPAARHWPLPRSSCNADDEPSARG